jgi:NAD(P)-dependent dehydrogenase (short-subunit alcohol dehydrogenase family)
MLIESKGRLFTTGSVAGTSISPMMGQYSMSKHAVEAMVDAWRVELSRYGVTVGVVEPGNFASNIGNAALARLNSINYWGEDTAYPQERSSYFQGLAQVDQGADPLPVAQATLDFMSADQPKVRYMVTPNANQAERIIQKLLSRVAQQNHDQAFSLDRATLIKLLDEELAKQTK